MDTRVIPTRDAMTERSFLYVKRSTRRREPIISVNMEEVEDRIVAEATEVNFKQYELK